MQFRSYNREIEKATAQMLDVFNDITIDRRSPDDTSIQQLIRVPCLYAARSRILKSIENRDNTVKLPLICISIAGISRDSSRVHSTNNGILYQDGGSGSYQIKRNTPVPVNITYNVTIITKFQEDMDQIAGNWVVWFNPDVYVVTPHPVLTGENLKSQVVWNGSLNTTYPEEIDKNSPIRVVSTTTFEYRTWMFPGLGYDDHSDKIVKRINFTGMLTYDVDGTGRLNGFYPVPRNMTMTAFTENIVLGLVKPPYWDVWQISGGLSGLWHDVSAICSGTYIDEILTGDPSSMCYLTVTGDDFSGMLLITDRCYLPKNMLGFSIGDYIDYYNSVYNVTGELFGYNGEHGYGLSGEFI
jgi:hypothetical protein